MKIPYVNLKKQYEDEKYELHKIIKSVLKSGNYVGGNQTKYLKKI